MRVRGLESPTELDFVARASATARGINERLCTAVTRADTMTRRSSRWAALMCLLGRAGACPTSNAPQASQRNVLGADTSAATRRVRRWRQNEEDTRLKQHSSLASQASSFGTEGVLLERFFPRGWPWARAEAARQFGKPSRRRQRSSLLCFIASVCRFRAAFFSDPGSISDSLRHSMCKAHITSKHSLASKTAAQRIKADICGSALPPSRNE